MKREGVTVLSNSVQDTSVEAVDNIGDDGSAEADTTTDWKSREGIEERSFSTAFLCFLRNVLDNFVCARADSEKVGTFKVLSSERQRIRLDLNFNQSWTTRVNHKQKFPVITEY